jgi:hypothetical protein
MVKRGWVVACLVAAACGGGGDGPGTPGGAATSKTFTYATPSAGSAPTSVSTALASGLALRSGATAAEATEALAAILALSGDALDGGGTGVFEPAVAQKIRERVATTTVMGMAPSGVPSMPVECTIVAADQVVFRDCRIVEESADGTVTITVSGRVGVTADTISWDYTMAMSMAQPGMSTGLSLREAGTFTLTATTAVAHVAADLGMQMSSPQGSVAFGVAQSLDLDLTHGECGVASGTLEAKRVWTARPRGWEQMAEAAELADRGVKFTWIDSAPTCGAESITVQYSL